MKAVSVVAVLLALGLTWAGWEIRTLRKESAVLRAELEGSRTDSAGTPASAGTVTTRLPRPRSETPAEAAPSTKSAGKAGSSPRKSSTAPASGLKREVLPDGSIQLEDGRLLTAAETESLVAASRKAVAEAKNKGPNGASYSAGKATGPPEANATGGDNAEAWCPAPKRAQGEWLQLKYPRSVEISEINIHETYATGALAKVSAVLPDGTEKTLWEGTEPRESPPVERVVKVPPGIRADQIRLTLDTSRIENWQEIDAVEMVGKDGSRQWASEATSSSHYGGNSYADGGWDYGLRTTWGTRRL